MGWQMGAALAALAVSAVLNALYYLPAVIRIWLPEKEHGYEAFKPDWRFSTAVVLLSAAVIALGICYAPLAELLKLGVGLL